MKSEQPEWEWAQKILADSIGYAPNLKPLYRFVWGEDRLEWVGGKWEDYDPVTGLLIRAVIEERQVPKYSHLGTNHWFVERWYPAEHFGTKTEWESKVIDREDGISIPARGPYPAHGEYDWAWTMEGPKGEYRELTFARVEWITGVIKDSERRTAAMRWAAQRVFAEFAKKAQHELDLELLKDATPAFHGRMRRGNAVTVL